MEAEAHEIRIVGGEKFACSDEERVLLAMERCAAAGIGVGCRSGGCGFCRVRVIEGKYRTGKMSAAKVSLADQAKGYVLACRLYPMTDLLIEVE